jgi:MoxR-like ATPase
VRFLKPIITRLKPEQEGVEMAKLVVRTGASVGAEFHLHEDRLTVGRDLSAEVRVSDDEISRRHAEVYRAGNNWVIKDLGSRNGTKINGTKIEGDYTLKPSDVVRVGKTELEFFDSEDEAAAGRSSTAQLSTHKKGEQEKVEQAKAADPSGEKRAGAQTAVNIASAPEKGEQISEEDMKTIQRLREARETILREIRKVIIGQEEVVEQMVIALFSRGHCLVVGVPGLAKTLMVSTISRVLDLEFKRVQFTPDLMPSDITGTDILQEDPSTKERSFKFIKGPIFTNMLLADEINRTPPKTQAALLEAMQEYRVTAGGVTYQLPLPFFVLATQNPIEQEGTYPLPEAQLDRFMFMVLIGYPTRSEEVQIVKATTYDFEPDLKPVLSAANIMNLQHIVRRVPISEHVVTYATDLARSTRPKEEGAPDFIRDWVSWGAGPRAAQYMVIGAKARTVINGRYNVSIKDVKAMAHPVLRHRVLTNFNADSEGIDSDDIIDRLLESVPEPQYEQ